MSHRSAVKLVNVYLLPCKTLQNVNKNSRTTQKPYNLERKENVRVREFFSNFDYEKRLTALSYNSWKIIFYPFVGLKLYNLSSLETFFQMSNYSKEQSGGLTQAFQYLSVSANSIFRRKASPNQKKTFKSTTELSYNSIKNDISNNSLIKQKNNGKVASTFDLRVYKDGPYSPYDISSLNDLSRSSSDITLSSSISTISDRTDDFQTPTPSTSSCTIMTSSVPRNNDFNIALDKDVSINLGKENTPWRLGSINEGKINTNYFFMDRDDNDNVSVDPYSER
ncbi:hypothetical protein K501DRAFT_270051 [Backusella circina FSU 941]|nr:hypothetical protein K501DRAFT_270051 [Backusella circina FSU 941]